MTALRLAMPPPSSRASRLLVLVAMSLSVALLALGADIGTRMVGGTESNVKLIDQVNADQLASTMLLSTLKDAEAGERGYLLTQDRAFLEPYRTVRRDLDADFAKLQAAPLATPGRMAATARIRQLAEAKIGELGRTIALRDAGNPEAAIALFRTDVGQHTMDLIRAEVDGLQSRNRVLLAQARSSIHATRHWAEAAVLTVVATALLAWVFWMKYRIGQDARASFYRLNRFRRAFGLAQGTLRTLDGRILFWNSGAEHLYGYSSEEAVGRLCRDLLDTRFPQPFEEIVQALRKQGKWQGELTCRHKDGRELHVLSNWALSRGEAGEPDVAIEVSTDITELKVAEKERARADALLRTVVETAPGLIYAKDRQGRMTLANATTLDLVGRSWRDIEGRTDLEFMADRALAERIMATDQRIMERGELEEFDEVVNNAESNPRMFSSVKAPLRDESGAVIGLVGVSLEITERKRIEDRLHLMVNELNHRVKNTLATVQAIASQTFRGADPVLLQKLEGRLMALAAAHDVLTRERWESAALEDVVADALEPFGGREGGRFELSGPPLRLAPRAALALALGLHELTTNALKYGALVNPPGQVQIAWDITTERISLFRLRWTERGGPPVTPPSKSGFGIRLIERSLAQDLGGTATVSFDDAQGIVAVVEAPIEEVIAAADAASMLRVGPRT